ncbi:auxin-responsive protein IAA2-like [Lolium rigidum]|uniref:auxin-responsive protein IAA2-like n=1 Tax=Lolium rigidum TaxID=89674 RepID=UPI001F5C3D5D|nr:auxin-responsive protein IAA2-like [Lolium rigidum]
MAWSGFRETAGESGLELRLGLPAYFSKPVAAAAVFDGEESTGAGDFARQPKGDGSNGYKAKPAVAAAPVVGWPPVRSFRRNLAASKPSSSKDGRGNQDVDVAVKAGAGDERVSRKGQFVKINMDGVPIGRKVELNEHGSYADLSAAVDNLFRGLLAAQRDLAASADGNVFAISGGDYTLVYEDDEGDRMLVGDVPWKMFIATAKRLRVLKSSDLPASSLTAGSRKRPAAADC